MTILRCSLAHWLIDPPVFLAYDSAFSIAYRRECVVAAVKLLEKICKGVKPTYNLIYTHIPVACLNLVTLVADFRDENLVGVILSAGCSTL